MNHNIQLLDCTLRDGAYIVDAEFGTPTIKGVIRKLQNARTEIIECGWLKDTEHKEGTTFFHVPSDFEQYLFEKRNDVVYVAMIDWDRYNLDFLPEYDGKSIDAIRVVFPYGKHKEAIKIGEQIEEKGYKVYFQAANTLAYSDDDLVELANDMNKTNAVALSVVDTFGAMYEEDLERIITVLNKELKKNIKMGFHSHNNQQLSFALTMYFVEKLKEFDRGCIVDASLCGMGRGAGNTTTELISSYLNRKQDCNYDLNEIMDAIDLYMQFFQEKYTWGYSTPYFIAGLYCTHVNNIAYLLSNHRASAKDMRNIIESMDESDRRKYDYDLLERKYLENQSRHVDDSKDIQLLKEEFKNRKILLIAPGKSIEENEEKIKDYIKENNPIVVEVNAVNRKYKQDYLFIVNHARYEYASEIYPEFYAYGKKILLSNIKTEPNENEVILNFDTVVKRGWVHFDNAMITCLRLMDKLEVENLTIAGFDGFKNQYNESYADEKLPSLNPDNKWDELNEEISDMFKDFKNTATYVKNIEFITNSIFNI